MDDDYVEDSSKMAENGSAAAVPVSYVEVSKSPHIRNLRQIEALEEKFDKGYDSDGEAGPFIRMEDAEGVQIFDENELPEEPPADGAEGATVVTIETSEGEKQSEEPQHMPIDEDTLKR